MNVIRRIAKPCGIVGGVWGLLAPILVLLPIMPQVIVDPVTGEQRRETVSMVEAGAAGSALPWLSCLALMGLLGILALLLRSSKPHISSVLIWMSALGMLLVCILSIFSLGWLFIPASILLILAAIGVRGQKELRFEAAK